ncbi:MAG: SMP-30/gluconolactonase/LRE family protein [Saprospiraceae bacterium]|nr:SMP-30/gluconolactonase/LRE family protein [Saprospiraceae bacterium]
MANKSVSFIFFLLLFIVGNLQAQKVEEIFMDTDMGSMPEGIAIDQNKGHIYMSSIRLDKVYRCDINGQNCIDVISSGQEGFTFGTGMMIVKNHLFVCGRFERAKKPMVIQIDLATNNIENLFKLPDSTKATFNDLTVDENWNVYMTDSDFSRIYRLDHKTGEISVFLEDVQIKGPNGICISDDQSKLYLSSTTFGIRIVDIATKKILNPIHDATIGKGIDGLKYYKNKLLVVYNYGGKEKEKQGLVEFALSENGAEILHGKDLTIGHARNNIPTTVGMYKGHAYYLANSQFDNYNWGENTVRRPGDLVKTALLKVKID